MKKRKIFEGTRKSIYQTEESEYTLLLSFSDNLRLSNGQVIEISGKGAINNTISAFLLDKLDMIGVDNHFIEKRNMREQLVQFVDIIPVVVSVSTIAAGRYVTDFGMEAGYVLDGPLIDFCIKSRELNYPPINEYQMTQFGWVSTAELEEIKKIALRVHDFLAGIFVTAGIRLVECKLEFGTVLCDDEVMVMLADEISPDTLKLWDMNTNKKFGFDAIESDPDSTITAYKEVLERLSLSL